MLWGEGHSTWWGRGQREEALPVAEVGKWESEAEGKLRGNRLQVGEEEEEEACQQDAEMAEKGEEGRQGGRPARNPASSLFRFPQWRCWTRETWRTRRQTRRI